MVYIQFELNTDKTTHEEQAVLLYNQTTVLERGFQMAK